MIFILNTVYFENIEFLQDIRILKSSTEEMSKKRLIKQSLNESKKFLYFGQRIFCSEVEFG